MTMETTPKPRWLRIVLGILVLSTGLSTIFIGLVTAWQAWEEHVQDRWPEVRAHVDACDLQQTSSGDPWYYIRCHLSYTVGSEQNVTSISSMNAPAREAWQYPPNQIEPFEKWLDGHPPGTPILVRYDPARHTRVVTTDRLVGGPHTQGNVRLLEICAGSFVILLTILLITRRHQFRVES
jgi:hypothetical protein